MDTIERSPHERENMMPRFLSMLAMALVAGAAVAADKYTIDSTFTVPTFEITHLGFTTQQGRFNHATGSIILDLAANKGSVEFTIDTTSVDMSSAAWSRHVADPGLFNVDKYPTMTYKSTALIFKDGKVVGADGDFTMLGITKPLHLTVSGFRCIKHPLNNMPVCGGDVTATIKRSEFGMKKYIPEVSDDIKIRVPVEAYKD
jgi:polyisoprenoid-binding protein YceI